MYEVLYTPPEINILQSVPSVLYRQGEILSVLAFFNKVKGSKSQLEAVQMNEIPQREVAAWLNADFYLLLHSFFSFFLLSFWWACTALLSISVILTLTYGAINPVAFDTI